MNNSTLTILPVAILLGAGFVAPVVYRFYRRALAPLVLITVGTCFVVAIVLAIKVVQAGPQRYFLGGWIPPWGIEVMVNSWSAMGVLAITGVGLPVMIYALHDSYEELAPQVVGRYFGLLLVLLASLVGVVIAADFFNLFVLVELSSLAACGIVAIKGDRLSTEASFRYLMLGTLGAGALLMAVAFLYMATGQLNMSLAGAEMSAAAQVYPRLISSALGLAILGLGIKAALFPLHLWLPDAHSSAPTTASALLSGLVVKVYILGLWRMLDLVFEPGSQATARILLLLMGSMATLFGSVMAMGQRDIKRLLAYSTVANVGYIFVGIGLNSPRALIGASLHIINHAVMKSGLFLLAGTIMRRTGTRDVRQFASLGLRLPWTMGLFTLAALSMVGVPLFSGFVSKWYLTLGAIDAGAPVYAVIILIASMLTGLYYFPIIIAAFFNFTREEPRLTEPLLGTLGPIVFLMLACVVLGIYPALLLKLLGQ